jgi:hypothetical protein
MLFGECTREQGIKESVAESTSETNVVAERSWIVLGLWVGARSRRFKDGARGVCQALFWNDEVDNDART